MVRKMLITLAAFLVPTAAVAQNGPREQVDAVVRCLDIAEVAARVACYDQAATALRAGLSRGEVVVERPRRPETPSDFSARITSVTPAGGRWVFALDNGHRWRTEQVQTRTPPPAGTEIRVRRNMIGSYWLNLPRIGEVRVTRIQ